MSKHAWCNRSLYENAARITFRRDGCCTRLSVVSRRTDGKHSFYLMHHRFLEWLEHGAGSYLEMDCGHLLCATEYDSVVTLQFYWMSEGFGGQLYGFIQSLSIASDKLRELLEQGGAFFTHSGKYAGRTQFDFSGAQRTLQKVCADPLKHRALSKALRNHISSRYSEVIHAYNDFPNCFYLIHTMSGNREHNGGLILHRGERNGKPYFRYDFHT